MDGTEIGRVELVLLETPELHEFRPDLLMSPFDQ